MPGRPVVPQGELKTWGTLRSSGDPEALGGALQFWGALRSGSVGKQLGKGCPKAPSEATHECRSAQGSSLFPEILPPPGLSYLPREFQAHKKTGYEEESWNLQECVGRCANPHVNFLTRVESPGMVQRWRLFLCPRDSRFTPWYVGLPGILNPQLGEFCASQPHCSHLTPDTVAGCEEWITP